MDVLEGLNDWLINIGVRGETAANLAKIIFMTGAIGFSVIVHLVLSKIIVKILLKAVIKTKNKLDDLLVHSKLLNANNMVEIGDWIQIPKYGADGAVLDIKLNTVKVQNWDKTVTSIPAYALISDSFKNWRGMQQSGGRRIKRSIFIDLNSIKFCDEKMLGRFRKIHYLKDYLEFKEKDIEKHNRERKIDTSEIVNGCHLTNIGTFRAYVVEFETSPKLSQDMAMIVRHLQPTEHGLPVEIYTFTNDTDWVNYEGIQAVTVSCDPKSGLFNC